MTDMRKAMELELKKLRRFHFHDFVYVKDIDEVRQRLKLSGVRYRTNPKKENGVIIGYNIYVL